MSPYAQSTSVPVDRSKAEVERILTCYGADQFAIGWDQSSAILQFGYKGLRVKFVMAMPRADDKRFTKTPTGLLRSAASAAAEHAQEVRRLWRSLAMAVKAKMECVESGISTFEQEFMPWVVMPDGRRVGDWLVPQLETHVRRGQMPVLAIEHVKQA